MTLPKKVYCAAIAAVALVVLAAVLVHGVGHTATADDATATRAAGHSGSLSQAALARRFAQSAASGATISGASQAVCSPGPCSRGSITHYTLTGVSNGGGTTSTRVYDVYRPSGLTSSDGNLAPAILTFYASGNCGFIPANRFASIAPTGRFIVVYMEVPCGRNDNWEKKNVETEKPTVVSDEPYVAAVVHAITSCPGSGGAPDQCVDPQRIYAAGMSSGGNMVGDIMCDAQNSTLFRGYLVDSASLSLNHGVPNCPSTNRSFFVMMALSDSGPDHLVYTNTAPHPHLDVPGFADWAAAQLGCPGPRIDDAIGSPVQSTLRYRYAGPCAYVQAGSAAVETLGVVNGGHTWGCQDSDAASPPNPCPGMPTPPGLGPGGLPRTNGLFIEGDFWNFVASGVSSATPAPPLVRPVGSATPGLGGYVSLGDEFASGEGNRPFAADSDTPGDRCHRSFIAYPFEADVLRGGPFTLSLHACAGATIASFYGATRRNHEPAQLHWLNPATRAVSLSVGWDDASLPAVLQSCVVDSSHCVARWHVRVDAAIRAMASRSRSAKHSLYALYLQIASRAPSAKIIVVGYPSAFPAAPRRCGTGVRGLSFTPSAMRWVNSEIRRLDGTIARAASGTRVTYLRASSRAFAGHERCTRQPDLNGPDSHAGAAALRSSSTLGASFTPNRRGQLALAKLVEKVL